jgi:carbamoyl-phosphate synthase small subunit
MTAHLTTVHPTTVQPATVKPASGRPAILVLEDGTTFRGVSFGADSETFGEMVFNTGMTGYQETLTDPSYARQIVAMTAPHIGNTGINDTDPESRRMWVSGYVVREPARIASNWRSERTLQAELAGQGVTGIAMSGTRALTRHLRDRGAMRAGISAQTDDPAELLERVLASPQMTGADLAGEVTTPEPYVVRPPDGTPVRYRVAAVDLGIKAATPRSMAALGCEVHVLPATATAAEILAARPDGVFFSNGPGDPAAIGYAVAAMQGVLQAGTPVFGICLGSQVLGRALGLATYKLRFGHRGVNQPVADVRTGRVQITSHNHGFAVALPGRDGPGDWLPGSPAAVQAGRAFDTAFGSAEITHLNLNDGVVEGLRLLDGPAFSVQYHPEAAPGPHDAAGLFTEFCELMEANR